MIGAAAVPAVVPGRLVDAACPVALRFELCKELHGMRSHWGGGTGTTGPNPSRESSYSDFDCCRCGRRFMESKEWRNGELVKHEIKYRGRNDPDATGLTGPTG